MKTAQAPVDDLSNGASTSDDVLEQRPVRTTTLARKETKAVYRVRLLVFGVLLSSMAAAAILVFINLTKEETDSFRKQYHEDATKVLASLKNTFEITLGGFDAFVVSTVSEAKDSNETWPFVTVSFTLPGVLRIEFLHESTISYSLVA